MSISNNPLARVYVQSVTDWWSERGAAMKALKVFVLVDEHTRLYCLPLFDKACPELRYHLVCIGAGEAYKSVESLCHVWEELTKGGATRKSVLINLGGGMITDLGGFAAATFKRGIPFIHIPTTLLGMVDASFGGKTAVNFAGYKNHVGMVCEAQELIVDVGFLRSLSPEHILCGYAEMLKHALISSKAVWEKMCMLDPLRMSEKEFETLIDRSLRIKGDIVMADPLEKNLRKSLNFGHTVAHALEGYAMRMNRDLPHGYAVAYGMIAELDLSVTCCGLDSVVRDTYVRLVRQLYGSIEIPASCFEYLYKYMQHDKKNESEAISFSLLSEVGKVKINMTCNKGEVWKALQYMNEM